MVVATDLKWYYSEGLAAGRPAAGSTDHAALGAHSLGGAPRPQITANEIPAFSGSEINLNALWDDTLEDENAGSGTVVNYRCVYLWNAADDVDGNNMPVAVQRTIYRAKLYAPRDLDANTAFAFAPLPLTNDSNAPTAGQAELARTIADESTLPVRNVDGGTLDNTTALFWRDIPSTSGTAINLSPAVDAPPGTAPAEMHLFGARYLGIWFRRTVTKTASPTGKIESITPTVIGGTPTA